MTPRWVLIIDEYIKIEPLEPMSQLRCPDLRSSSTVYQKRMDKETNSSESDVYPLLILIVLPTWLLRIRPCSDFLEDVVPQVYSRPRLPALCYFPKGDSKGPGVRSSYKQSLI